MTWPVWNSFDARARAFTTLRSANISMVSNNPLYRPADINTDTGIPFLVTATVMSSPMILWAPSIWKGARPQAAQHAP
jgi:hypothetical protein